MPDVDRRVHVLFAIGAMVPTGGAERQLLELLTRLDAAQVRCTLATRSPVPDGPQRDRLLRAGVALVAARSRRSWPRPARVLAAALFFDRVLRRERPHVAYAWLEESALYLMPLARLHGTRAMVARRNVSGARIERFAPVRAVVTRAERLAHIATANSHAVVEDAVARGVPRERVRLIRNGHPLVPALAPPGRDHVVLGYLAGFRPGKGHDRFVRALAHLRTGVPWRARLAGDGTTLAATRRLARRLGVLDRLDFAGRVEDARAFWADCDVAVLLSDNEGSPNALIEGAFAGRPLVATRVGGTPEVLGDQGPWLVEADDGSSAARRLLALVEDPALRAAEGHRAHAVVSARFAIDATVAGHAAAIRDALAR